MDYSKQLIVSIRASDRRPRHLPLGWHIGEVPEQARRSAIWGFGTPKFVVSLKVDGHRYGPLHDSTIRSKGNLLSHRMQHGAWRFSMMTVLPRLFALTETAMGVHSAAGAAVPS